MSLHFCGILPIALFGQPLSSPELQQRAFEHYSLDVVENQHFIEIRSIHRAHFPVSGKRILYF